MKLESEIKYLIDYYYQIQKHRIEVGNQIFALKERGEKYVTIEMIFSDLNTIESKVEKIITQEIKNHPMWPWFKAVKGIGPIFAAGLATRIDIVKAEHASSVWKYAGLAPGQKRVKGQKIDYDPWVKTLCWKIGESFIKTKGKYREIYDTSKAYYQHKFPKEIQLTDANGKPKLSKEGKPIMLYNKAHIHNMSRRRTVKLFLSHMWAYWRELEGLSVSEPFAHRIGAPEQRPEQMVGRVVSKVQKILKSISPKKRARISKKTK